MSSLTAEVREVFVITLHTPIGPIEIDEYDYECLEGARARAREEVSEYVEKTGAYAYCTIEYRVVPIYK